MLRQSNYPSVAVKSVPPVLEVDLRRHDGFPFVTDDGKGFRCTQSTIAPFKRLDGYRFDGANNAIYIPCINANDFNIGVPFSVEAVFDPNATSASCRIFDKGTVYHFDLNYPAISSYLGWRFYFWGLGYVQANSSIPWISGKWNHAVGVYDGSNMICYLNGVRGVPVNVAGSTPYSSQPGWGLSLGGFYEPIYGYPPQLLWPGKLMYFALHKYPKSPEQISRDYQQWVSRGFMTWR